MGTLVVLGGLVLIPFPGPGWLIVIAGLAILASEFAWAKSVLDVVKAQVEAWTRWTVRQPAWLRAVIAVLTVAFVYAVIAVMLHVVGVPGWVPDWVPLWR